MKKPLPETWVLYLLVPVACLHLLYLGKWKTWIIFMLASSVSVGIIAIPWIIVELFILKKRIKDYENNG